MAQIISDNVQQDGTEVVLYDDGSTVITDSAGNTATYSADGTLISGGNISMTTQPSNPPANPPTSQSNNTTGVTSFLNSAGSFGVSLASIITRKPVVVNKSGTPVGVGTGAVAGQPNYAGLLLLLVGIVILVSVMHK